MYNVLLMYHCVFVDNGLESGFQNELAFDYKISQNKFEEQIKNITNYLSNNGICYDFPIFTFDDGGVSAYTVIAPILDKYHQKGLFFIPTQFIDSPGFLSAEQILDLYKRGHFIGSHSHSHPINMNNLSYNDVYEEWKKSINILSSIIKDRIIYGSIPNGYYSAQILEAAFSSGIQYLFTSDPICKMIKYKSMSLLGRYVILNGDNNQHVQSIVINAKTRNIIFLKWYFLKVIKKILGKKYSSFRNFIVCFKK